MAELTKLAEESPRRRTHFNLHESLDEGIHRLCIAAEPDTVIHPHRHKDKWELFFLLKGAADVYTYDDSGKITGSWHMVPGGEVPLIEIPEGVWHHFVCREHGTVAFEVKKVPTRRSRRRIPLRSTVFCRNEQPQRKASRNQINF